MKSLADFLSELKHRRVYRVAVVYAGVAFIISEIVANTIGYLNLPDSFGTAVIVILIIGFPIVIGLAWAFDITDEGIVRAKRRPVDAKRKAQPLLGNKSLAVIAVLAIIVAVWALLRGPSPGDAVINSVAVLPLDNLSGDPEQEYYVGGMHDALTGEMSRISALRVIGRTSTLRYKENPPPITVIAEELDVDAVVEGSVLPFPDGETIRIIAQVVVARPEHQIFYKEYFGNLTDILMIHKTIVTDIAAEIGLTLTPEEEAHLASAPQVDPEAYDLYLLGWELRNQENAESIRRAMENLERAVELDPTFALAYANLTIIYGLAYRMGIIGMTESVEKARIAVNQALALDPNLAQAHVNNGILIYYVDSPNVTTAAIWDEAGAALRRGVELNPGLLDAHYEYGFFLIRSTRYDEAITHFLKVQEISPLSQHAYQGLGATYFTMGQFEQAFDYSQMGLALEPTNIMLKSRLIRARRELLRQQGNYKELLAVAQTYGSEVLALLPQFRPLDMMIAYRGMNEDTKAAALFDSLSTDYLQRGVNKGQLSRLYAYYGDYDGSLDLLEEHFSEISLGVKRLYMTSYNSSPWELHDDPRYQALMVQTGLQY